MSNRYEVTVERKFIVYAETPEDADAKVRAEVVRGLPCVTPKALTVTVSVLPDVREEAHGPEVDVAPARETRT
jgi:hypothetical protein